MTKRKLQSQRKHGPSDIPALFVNSDIDISLLGVRGVVFPQIHYAWLSVDLAQVSSYETRTRIGAQ